MRARARLLFMLAATCLALAAALTSCARESHGPPLHAPPPPHLSVGPGPAAAGAVHAGPAEAPPVQVGPSQHGLATYYGDSLAGNETASGEVYDPRAMTAAHRKLAFGTQVEVIRKDTGARVRVRITDRGPFGDERRIIDVSRAAAEQLDMIRAGVVEVEVRVLR